MNEKNTTLGGRISELLEARGLTQRELADRAGVTEVSMSRYISGGRVPRAAILSNIATVLNTTSEYLLGTEVPGDFDSEYSKIHRLIARNAPKMTMAQKRDLVNAILESTDD